MISLTSLNNKLDALLTYSQTNAINSGDSAVMQAVVSAFKSVASGYYSSDRKAFREPLYNLQLSLYSDIYGRHEVTDKHMDMHYDNNYPDDYLDLRKLFLDLQQIMDTTNESFFNAWVYETSTNAETGVSTSVAVSNTLIDSWDVLLDTAINDELTRIKALISWLSSSMSDADAINLWEDTGEVISQIETPAIANIIFIDRGLKEAKECLNLPCYIPSYI